jgi:broad specificity phosphatase PhoE
MLRLLFVRHGRTSWNAQGRVQGGGGLDEVGRLQAAALADRLRSERLDAIYASPAWRARQTAMAVARVHDLPVRQRHLLRDLNYGRFAGALLADLMRERPDLVETWRTTPHLADFPEGERLSDLRARIERFIYETYKAHPVGTVLAATHDSPIRVAASIAEGWGDEQHNRKDLVTPLASITTLEVKDGEPKLVGHKDVEHLAGIDATS